MSRLVILSGEVKRKRAEAKASPKWATQSLVVDAKLHELPMSRLNRGLYRVEDRTHLG